MRLPSVTVRASVLAYGSTGYEIIGGIADKLIANTPAAEKIYALTDRITLEQALMIADENKCMPDEMTHQELKLHGFWDKIDTGANTVKQNRSPVLPHCHVGQFLTMIRSTKRDERKRKTRPTHGARFLPTKLTDSSLCLGLGLVLALFALGFKLRELLLGQDAFRFFHVLGLARF